MWLGLGIGPLLPLGFAPRLMAPKTTGLLLSFESKGTEVLYSDAGISSSCWFNLPSASKKGLTSIFRTTI